MDLPSAEFIFEAGDKGVAADKGKAQHGDYHNNMDADMFMIWVKNRLVPAFQARYPGKKMILVLDNVRNKFLYFRNNKKLLLYFDTCRLITLFRLPTTTEKTTFL